MSPESPGQDHGEAELLYAFELHDPGRIASLLDSGIDVNGPIGNGPPIDRLLEMYTRSDRFGACTRLLIDRGATLRDPWIAPLVRDEPSRLAEALRSDPTLATRRLTLPCAFTPLEGVTMLHIAAEFGLVECARVLVAAGADVNAAADLDAHGLGGQTPIFHTVNSHANRSLPVMEMLLDAGARATHRIDGLVWGRRHEWETVLCDLTPIAYAQCGLLPQFHRDPVQITANVRQLLAASGRAIPSFDNVPNRYLVTS